jgi:hypothetical protein
VRESLVEILNDNPGVVQNQVPVYQRRNAIVGIEVQKIFRKIPIVNLNDIYIDTLLGENKPGSMTPDVGRPGKECHD